MASSFHVQNPYVLATLPRPLDPTTGTYVVGEVYGHAPGSRKRKRRRAELTVGIDGEAINIYDISSSRLIISYPIPPESRISCPPTSTRYRSEATKHVSRYTYAASDESSVNKITLFKDTVGESGKTEQLTRSASLGKGRPVVWLSSASSHSEPEGAEANPDTELLTVRSDGEIVCLDGESLKSRWVSKPLALLQDLPEDARADFNIDFCRNVSAPDAVRGIFKGNNDAFALLSASGQSPDEDTEVFVLISSAGPAQHRSRHLHIVGRLPSSQTSSLANRGVVQLHVMPLVPSQSAKGEASSYRLDARNGALIELSRPTIVFHDLTASVPKVASTMELNGTTSFLSLSKTSLLCATNTQLHVFNPVYRSMQNTVDIDLAGNNDDSAACQLVAYFPPLERAISIIGSHLVAIQLEAPKTRHAKRRAEGLLIDSIGRGLPATRRSSAQASKGPPKNSVFSNYIPGSMRGDYWEKWTAEEKKADSYLSANDITNFETFLAEKFGIPLKAPKKDKKSSTDASSQDTLRWQLPGSRNYPPVDRRWILYTISRSFQWNTAHRDDSSIPRLIFQLPQSNILNYLADAGHLTLSNLRAAFRDKINETEAVDSFLATELVTRLSEIDPTLNLLVVYLDATNIGALEILLALKTLLKSLELINNPDKSPSLLTLTNGTAADEASNPNHDDKDGDDAAENEDITMELDALEEEIQKTVSYLNTEDAGIRGRGLSVAFAKLGACPSQAAIKALRATFRPEEVLSLMYVLRIELVRGGWTDRYVVVKGDENNNGTTEYVDDEPPPDASIKLIADILGLCLDSLGPSGWILNDAGDDVADFVGSLTHEVSAALEGLEETVALKNFIAGPVKYVEEVARRPDRAVAVPDGNRGVGNANMKPVAVRVSDNTMSAALPLGLKAASGISGKKVVSGGEIVQRSRRETGHLISQKVGSYSLERIMI
ncbi:hypothetical protein F4808DRAFT_195651 [Astrocystis sublimbata]|nr:hypothetical protein F4808DRAFT_195651 [Astrocystis sublimbata]